MMLRLLPNDLQLMIYNEIHRSVTLSLIIELYLLLKWDDDQMCYLNESDEALFQARRYDSDTHNWVYAIDPTDKYALKPHRIFENGKILMRPIEPMKLPINY